jgi:hypothetical protein
MSNTALPHKSEISPLIHTELLCQNSRGAHGASLLLVRVISWIACYAQRKAIHEITRTNTNGVPTQNRVLTQSLQPGVNERRDFQTLKAKPPDTPKILNAACVSFGKTRSRSPLGVYILR